jgi:hypothetical protein
MHWIFAAARLFPYWALPLAVILAELAIYLRRRGSRRWKGCLGAAIALVILLVLWVVFRGDLNSNRWLQQILPSAA